MAILAVVLMYSVFLVIGWRASRKSEGGNAEDLIIAGRSMPVWIAVLTMTATWVDGGYLLGTAEGVFKGSVALGAQGGLCFGISLILGGLLFAKRMRALEYTTLIDPFEARFGRKWAAVLFIPAMLGEVFWSAELLVAIGSTVGVMTGIPLGVSILLSAFVVTAYTILGGMWSVAYTDSFQLALVALGLLVAVPIMLHATGGLMASWHGYSLARPDRTWLIPQSSGSGGYWNPQSTTAWIDVSAMLIFGGIPWNCYFQRVLSCRTADGARAHSILAGGLTMLFVIPPLLMGIAAFGYQWSPADLAQLQAQPSQALPLMFLRVTPPLVSILGLWAIIGAVTSSFSSSILSAGTMFSWNCCYRLIKNDLSPAQLKRLIRLAILLLAIGATVMAFKVQSVQELWFFTSDLIFVLLFPQLLYALFDSKTNLYGSIAGFSASLILRLGGGEPLFGIPPVLPYAQAFAKLTGGTASQWTVDGVLQAPYKSIAAIAGLVLIPLVSRLTVRLCAPLPLRKLDH